MSNNSPQSTPPRHVAIIMDGNGRWAKRQGLPAISGHREGASVLKRITRHAHNRGINHLTVFAFSSENWKRPLSWVDDLMGLLRYYLKNEINEIIENNIQLKIIGDKDKLAPDIQELIRDAETRSSNCTGINLNVAVSYGGRDDIIQACQKLAAQVRDGTLTIDEINPLKLSETLFSTPLPDPDLLIRTSGEMRVSNFMLWQIAYTELVFSDKLWPDFKEEDFDNALEEFYARDRRYGAKIGS